MFKNLNVKKADWFNIFILGMCYVKPIVFDLNIKSRGISAKWCQGGNKDIGKQNK